METRIQNRIKLIQSAALADPQYKNAMMNYVTEECFNTEFTDGFKEQNGLLYCFNGGGSGLVFEVESIRNKDNTTYIADVNIYVEENEKELKSYEFAIENYNNKCVISYCK